MSRGPIVVSPSFLFAIPSPFPIETNLLPSFILILLRPGLRLTAQIKLGPRELKIHCARRLSLPGQFIAHILSAHNPPPPPQPPQKKPTIREPENHQKAPFPIPPPLLPLSPPLVYYFLLHFLKLNTRPPVNLTP